MDENNNNANQIPNPATGASPMAPNMPEAPTAQGEQGYPMQDASTAPAEMPPQGSSFGVPQTVQGIPQNPLAPQEPYAPQGAANPYQPQQPYQDPSAPVPIDFQNPQAIQDYQNPGRAVDPVDPHRVGLQSPVLAPSQFDNLQPLQSPQAAPENPAMSKPINPEQAVKKFTILSVILGVLAMIGIVLGIIGLVGSGNANSELEANKQVLANYKAIVDEVSSQTGKTINDVNDLPAYKAVKDYIYIPDWNIKIEKTSALKDLSYILDQNFRPQICFTGYETNITQFPEFADIEKNPRGMGCLTRVAISEGNVNGETGESFGLQVFSDNGYNYFYWKDEAFVYSQTDADKGLEATAVQKIKSMLQNGISHFE